MTIDNIIAQWSKRNFITAGEIAAFLEVHPRTVIRWWESDKTPLRAFHPTTLGYKGFRFTAESVVSFIHHGLVIPSEFTE